MKNTLIIIFSLVFALAVTAQEEPARPFITTWETTAANETIIIPTDTTNYPYNYTVDWGDGSTDNRIYTGNATHEYAVADTYRVTISGTFPRIRFAQFIDKVFKPTPATRQIRTVEQWGDIEWASMKLAFAGCSDLTINASDVPKLSTASDMGSMFFRTSLTGKINEWNVSSITNMRLMFYESSFNQDISDWNVSSVIDMRGMFAASSFNQDISNWDISNIETMKRMFWNNISMSSENYDKLLIGWSTLDTQAGETRIPSNIAFHAPPRYSCRGKAGRDVLSVSYSWSITKDELILIQIEEAPLTAVTAQCEATAADLNIPKANNKCDGMGTTVTATHNISADVFPITSDTIITWTYTDAGKSIVQTQKVTVNKIIPNVLSLKELTTECQINSLTPPTAINCSGKTIIATHDLTLPITSDTTITWTYTDTGKRIVQTQKVTVNKIIPNVLSLKELTAECQINSLTPPMAMNCSGETLIAMHNIPTGAFPITSDTTITWTYIDAGSMVTQTQQMTITLNNTDPVPDAILNIFKSAKCKVEEAELTIPTATDFCNGRIRGVPSVEGGFPITSDVMVIWTYTDQAGNDATQMQQVTTNSR